MAKKRIQLEFEDGELEALLTFIERSNHGDYRCYSNSMDEADKIKRILNAMKEKIVLKLKR